MWDGLIRWYRDATASALADGGGGGPVPQWKRLALDALHILVVLVRESGRDRVPVRAAMLSYWTMVAIVPLLLLAFALTGPLGLAEETRDALQALLFNTILANSVGEIGDVLDALLRGTTLRTLGLFGVAGIMLTGSRLYFQTELAYNDIYSTRVRRSRILRFTLFYSGLTLGPMLLASGFVASSRLNTAGLLAFPSHVLPVLLSAVAFVSAIWLLPSTRVSVRAALVGGLFTAVAFEAAKFGFAAYMDVFGTRDSMARVYGSLAFLPVFLLWLHVLWMVVLIGVEVSYVTQHFDRLLEAQRQAAVDVYSERRSPDPLFALSVMVAVGAHYASGCGPADPEVVAQQVGASPRHVNAALQLLEDAGLLVDDEHGRSIPARPPDQIRAADVLIAWRRVAAPRMDPQRALAHMPDHLGLDSTALSESLTSIATRCGLLRSEGDGSRSNDKLT